MTTINQIFKIILAISLFSLVIGCKKTNPNPELTDPIYLDLVKAHGEAQKELEDEEKNLVKLVGELENTKPRTMSRVTATSDVKKSKSKIAKLKQLVEYLRIRKDRRRVEGRRSYRIAFEKGEKWPDPKEYKAYKQYNKLKNASLNWNERVPKLNHNNPNYDRTKKALDSE